MLDKAKVSIITVCYNSEKTIERTIKSVLEQTAPAYEYIIVDGASTDGTLNIIKKYEPLFEGRMRIVSEPDKGIYDAMNKGIGLASGEVIGIINSDDWYEKDTIEIVQDGYDGTDYSVIYGEMNIWTGNEFSTEYRSHENLKEGMINHPTCFVTKKTYDTYGVFDLQYCSVADYDLMLRYKEIPEIRFIPIRKVLANFSSGGMCSSQKAYFDLLKMEVNYGWKTKREASVLRFKAKVSSMLGIGK